LCVRAKGGDVVSQSEQCLLPWIKGKRDGTQAEAGCEEGFGKKQTMQDAEQGLFFRL
jgi:hypothetical protein